jgi:hypothetical protein
MEVDVRLTHYFAIAVAGIKTRWNRSTTTMVAPIIVIIVILLQLTISINIVIVIVIRYCLFVIDR